MSNEELKMSTDQPRTFGRRLWWIIRTTLLIFIFVALIAAVLAGLGYAGLLGVQEIQRSNNSLAMRIDANEHNLNSLRDLVNSEFAEGNPEQQVQINELENRLASLTNQLEALQITSAEDAAIQGDQIDELEAELATAVAHSSTLAADLDAVEAALVALQSDLNNNVSRVDALGGEADNLRLQLDALESSLLALTDDTTAARDDEAAALQQDIALLHLWGVVTNARLYLADGDLAQAETAVAQAMQLAANLSAEPDTPTAAALLRLQTRLILAADGFAADLPMVEQDLIAASREIDLILTGITEAVEAVETATPTAEIEETAAALTATAETTPSATPSATLPPAPTATPTP